MRIYLDVCCLNRPFDDQSQPRVRVETEAIIGILDSCRAGEHTWVTSEAVAVEVRRDPNLSRRKATERSMEEAGEYLQLTDAAIRRATALLAFGLKIGDALHVALAELGRCEALLTTDDRFIRAASRVLPPLLPRVMNPVKWCVEDRQ